MRQCRSLGAKVWNASNVCGKGAGDGLWLELTSMATISASLSVTAETSWTCNASESSRRPQPQSRLNMIRLLGDTANCPSDRRQADSAVGDRCRIGTNCAGYWFYPDGTTRFQLEEDRHGSPLIFNSPVGAVAVGSTASLIGSSDASATSPAIGPSPEIDMVKGTLDDVDVEFAKGGNGKGWKRWNRGRHLGWGRGRRRGPPMYARRRTRHGRRGYGPRFY